MMNTTLVIMAAGIGSRFGGGIKQLEKMGPNGEIIMDYSIYDAKKAGFNKIVFIIRKDIEEDFKEIIGKRIESVIDVEYVFQEKEALPMGFQAPAQRSKPWGTGQAVLMCKDVVKEPFAVINADDFYGAKAFTIIQKELMQMAESSQKLDFCMAGFHLGNTLSENGTVTRGICVVGDDGYLERVCETSGIRQVNGKVIHDPNGCEEEAQLNTHVSMNMWGLTPEFFQELEDRFITFLEKIEEDDLKKEYLLPMVIDELVYEGKSKVKVLETDGKWFGVTYKEDKPVVVNSIRSLITNGTYPENLWG